MNQFTAARAEQHRADLMTAAQHARDARLAKSDRQHALRGALDRSRRPPLSQAGQLLAPAPATR